MVATLQQGAQDYLVKECLTPLHLNLPIQRTVAAVRRARERDEARASRAPAPPTAPAPHPASASLAATAQWLRLAIAAAQLNMWDWASRPASCAGCV